MLELVDTLHNVLNMRQVEQMITLMELDRSIFQLGCKSVSPAASSSSDVLAFLPTEEVS